MVNSIIGHLYKWSNVHHYSQPLDQSKLYYLIIHLPHQIFPFLFTLPLWHPLHLLRQSSLLLTSPHLLKQCSTIFINPPPPPFPPSTFQRHQHFATKNYFVLYVRLSSNFVHLFSFSMVTFFWEPWFSVAFNLLASSIRFVTPLWQILQLRTRSSYLML